MKRLLFVLLVLCYVAAVGPAQRRPKPTMAILPIIHVRHPLNRTMDVERRKDLAYRHAEAKLKRAGFEVLPRSHVERLLEKSGFYFSNPEDMSERALRQVRIELGCDSVAAISIDYRDRPYMEPKNPPRGSPSPQEVFRAVTGGSPNHTRLTCEARIWLIESGEMLLDDVSGEAAAGQENHAVWRAVEKVVDPYVSDYKKRIRHRR